MQRNFKFITCILLKTLPPTFVWITATGKANVNRLFIHEILDLCLRNRTLFTVMVTASHPRDTFTNGSKYWPTRSFRQRVKWHCKHRGQMLHSRQTIFAGFSSVQKRHGVKVTWVNRCKRWRHWKWIFLQLKNTFVDPRKS